MSIQKAQSARLAKIGEAAVEKYGKLVLQGAKLWKHKTSDDKALAKLKEKLHRHLRAYDAAQSPNENLPEVKERIRLEALIKAGCRTSVFYVQTGVSPRGNELFTVINKTEFKALEKYREECRERT